MTRDTREVLQKDDTQGSSGKVDARRRRLLTAGATSPLLMTIASRPAWAQGGQCTPSAMASANASGGHDFDGCSISAGWWKNSKERWPISDRTAFHSIFAPVKYNGSVLYEGHSLGNVIDLNGGKDPVQGNLGFHLIGAYLNALAFPPDRGVPGYAFTPQQVVEAYNALYSAGGGSSTLTTTASGSSFQTLASTLETANNQFDSTTVKPEPWE